MDGHFSLQAFDPARKVVADGLQHLMEHEDVNLTLVGTMSTMGDELRPYARAVFEFDQHTAAISRA